MPPNSWTHIQAKGVDLEEILLSHGMLKDKSPGSQHQHCPYRCRSLSDEYQGEISCDTSSL